ncbi:hypothetical protein Acid345_1439 [Candidatus Koribacter versatilis Ellin345]|uniref:DUF2975 domain-containing protein n=1 Tax=Koribacter versatilis (strain Ellin345) TaxID=204669 RepID=Q1IRQ9_KORVE|nr:DUF2975 domain-containing protein [Candidatus Koribacter versatilis]ABF40441.1 hypothetical protein Acid345_1439 [Candidatus Koribacter versatilis Ellin345]
MTVLFVGLASLIVLERFGWVAVPIVRHTLSRSAWVHLADEVVGACPEVLFLLSLWGVRAALQRLAQGDLYGAVMVRMLKRVGAMVAAGSFLKVFVEPAAHRWLGYAPGYWIAYDVSGVVLGVVGLALIIVARVLENAAELKAELDGIF